MTAPSPEAPEQGEKSAWTVGDLETLALIRRNYATDVHRTAGKFPVMTLRAARLLQPLADCGLLAIDTRDCPMKAVGKQVMMGECWVSLTAAGEAALLAAGASS